MQLRYLRPTWLAIVLLLAALLSGCGSQNGTAPGEPTAAPPSTPTQQPSSATLGQPFTLKIQQSTRIESEALAIAFDKVLEDSRCPTKVACAWIGRANISVTVQKGAQPRATLTLMTIHSPQQTDRAAYAGYEIRFVDLTPRSEYPDQPVTMGDYVATLEVTKLPAP